MAKRGKIRRNSRKKTIEKLKRPINIRKYKHFFLIVCEDTKTEPTYFEQFKAFFPPNTLHLEMVGTGKSPLGVVQACITERHRLKVETRKEIDFVWAVFDKDDADKNNTKSAKFEAAFALAKQEHIHIAYSNEVFELWLLLHLRNIDMKEPIPRRQIYEMLAEKVRKPGTKYENFIYEHGKSNIIAVIAAIGNEKKAIERAEKLLEYHENKPPLKTNPSTLVHILVKELRAWIVFYNWKA
ncbi:MAG: RloB family protein [Chitinophagales bacterium]